VLEVVLEVVVLVVLVVFQLRRMLLVDAVDGPTWLVWRSRGCFEIC
jgi:hypothetical protein